MSFSSFFSLRSLLFWVVIDFHVVFFFSHNILLWAPSIGDVAFLKEHTTIGPKIFFQAGLGFWFCYYLKKKS